MTKTNYIIKFLVALVIAYLVTGVATLVAALVAFKCDLSENLMDKIVSVIYVAAGVAGGFYLGKTIEKRRIILGIIHGLFYSSIIVLISVISSKGASLSDGGLLSVVGLSALGGAIGGMLS